MAQDSKMTVMDKNNYVKADGTTELPKAYRASSGETLESIAKLIGVSSGSLAQANPFYVGKKLNGNETIVIKSQPTKAYADSAKALYENVQTQKATTANVPAATPTSKANTTAPLALENANAAINADYAKKKQQKNEDYFAKQQAIISSVNDKQDKFQQASAKLQNALVTQRRTTENKSIKQGINSSSIADELKQQVKQAGAASMQQLSQTHTQEVQALQTKLDSLQKEKDSVLQQLDAARQKALKKNG